jgi:hypothetical protein
MKLLDCRIEQQKCSQWCWAAVASAVCFAYKDNNAPTQSDVVDFVLGAPAGSQCNCTEDPSAACNRPMPLPPVLDAVGHAGEEDSGMRLVDVRAEIDRERPIVVQVVLPDAAATQHAVAIYGYGDGDIVVIADPMHAGDLISVSLTDLVAGTGGGFHGKWQTAYRTIPK